MHPATILTAFATVFVAELPDKTMLATIVLSARFKRPWPVWFGAAGGRGDHHLQREGAGGLLNLLPDRPVKLAVAVLFAVGAVLLWRSAGEADEEAAEADAEAEAARALRAAPLPWWKVTTTVFGVVFLAEWGDLTQLATASLASNGRPLSVFVGAAAAMITVAGIGVIAGQALLRVLPERLLRQVAAGIFAALAVLAAVSAVRG